MGGHFILDDSVINQGKVRDTATTYGRQVLSSYSRLHTSHNSILKTQTVNDTEDTIREGGGLLSLTLGTLLLLLTQNSSITTSSSNPDTQRHRGKQSQLQAETMQVGGVG